MANIGRAGRSLGDSADRDHLSSPCQALEEALTGRDLGVGRVAIRALGSGVRGDHVPAERVVGDAKRHERLADDRRGRFRRAAPRQLPLRGEGKPADAGASVARRLADEEQRGLAARLQIGPEPPA
jgi:hypothetical protein